MAQHFKEATAGSAAAFCKGFREIFLFSSLIANNSVARFSVAIVRNEKDGEDNKRTSAFIQVEAWRKNEKAETFNVLKAKTHITVEGYFRPEEWTDKDGKKQQRVTLVANKFYETPDKEEESE